MARDDAYSSAANLRQRKTLSYRPDIIEKWPSQPQPGPPLPLLTMRHSGRGGHSSPLPLTSARGNDRASGALTHRPPRACDSIAPSHRYRRRRRRHLGRRRCRWDADDQWAGGGQMNRWSLSRERPFRRCHRHCDGTRSGERARRLRARDRLLRRHGQTEPTPLT